MPEIVEGLALRLAEASDNTRAACRVLADADTNDKTVHWYYRASTIACLERTEREARQLLIHARSLRRRYVAQQRAADRAAIRAADRIVNERRTKP